MDYLALARSTREICAARILKAIGLLQTLEITRDSAAIDSFFLNGWPQKSAFLATTKLRLEELIFKLIKDSWILSSWVFVLHSQMADIRGNNKKYNLLKFLILQLEQSNPEALNFTDELKTVQKAATCELKYWKFNSYENIG